jgi:anaerobic selenocysteine-containing dehydrogenase
MHVDDAAELHIADGDLVRVNSPHGAIELPVTATKDIVAGVIAVPHRWSHKGSGGWRTPQGGEREPADVQRARRPGTAGRVDGRAGPGRAGIGQTRCATSALSV